MLDKIKEKKSIISILVVVFFVFLISFFLLTNNYGIGRLENIITKGGGVINMAADSAYTIPNVPYYSMHKHFEKHDLGYTNNSVLSIIEYWQPGLVDVLESKNNPVRVSNINDSLNFLSQNNFSVKTLKLSFADLKRYINPEVRTPLLVSIPISAEQPDELMYHPTTAILIGIDEKAQKLTLHDYWLGNNYEMSYSEFDQLENKLPNGQRYFYTIIQPNDLAGSLKEISQRKVEAYPVRTSIMQKGEGMFKNYAVGVIAYNAKMYNIAREYFFKVQNDPQFMEYFPPFLKTDVDYHISQIYYAENNLDSALAYARKAVDENHDLNQSFKDWTGMTIDWRSGDSSRLSSPYSLLGDIYRQKKDFQAAKDNYMRALEIAPNDARAKDGIDILNALAESK